MPAIDPQPAGGKGRVLRHVALFGTAGVAAVVIMLSAMRSGRSAPPDSPEVASAAYAKMMCTGTFVSHLSESQIRKQDLGGVPALPTTIDRVHGVVTVKLEAAISKADYREGLGCTLENGQPLAALPPDVFARREAAPSQPLPMALSARFDPVLDRAFAENDPARVKNTRAVLVLQHGDIVAERYAPGINADTPLPGYSMSKSVANLLVGTAVRRGWLALGQDDLRPEWRVSATDGRRKITLDELLRMTSGLAWNEDYLGTDSDLMQMLTSQRDPAAYAAGKPLATGRNGRLVAPGEHWLYSGGSYELVSAVLAQAEQAHGQLPLAYPFEALFQPLGMTSVVLEPAPNGVPMLSSFMLAKARDWARLGEFLLDAQHEGPTASRLLPPGWLTESLHPTAAGGTHRERRMAAGFWLGGLGPDVPENSFYLAGYQGQFVVVVPDLDLVVVRLGASPVDGTWAARELMTDLVPLFEPLQKNLSHQAATHGGP